MVNIDIACHLKAHAGFALQSNGSVGGIGPLTNDDGGPDPKTQLLEQLACERAAHNHHDHSGQPNQKPPHARRIPTGGRNERHVEQGQAGSEPQNIAQLIPKGSTVAVVLKPHEK